MKKIFLALLVLVATSLQPVVSSAQSEFLTYRQSGVTVSGARFSPPWNAFPSHHTTGAITATINDIVDLGFSYTGARNSREVDVRTLSFAAHLNSQPRRNTPQYAAILETNLSSLAGNALFLGVEIYRRHEVSKLLTFTIAFTSGLLTVTPKRHGASSESSVAGSFNLGFTFAAAEDLKITLAPFYGYSGLAPDVVGISVGLTIHSRGQPYKKRVNPNWDELSYVN